MNILDWIKANAKDGANIAEAEELVSGGMIDGITTKDQAIELINKNAAFRSAADSLIHSAVKSHDERFMAEKFPNLIAEERDKIRAELQPNETPEQKRIRELEELVKAGQAKERQNELMGLLRNKATELGFDPGIAERFSVYGENAVDMLETVSGYSKGVIEAEKDRIMNDALKGQPPKGVKPELTKEITPDSVANMDISEVTNLFK